MLYTRKGDDGKTRLFNTKRRVSKLSCDIEALGALDELNSSIGICYALVNELPSSKKLRGARVKNLAFPKILAGLLQHLFVIQAEVAGADKTLTKKHVAFLEEVTDTVEKIIPPIRSFTLPGATILSAHLDRARTLARRAERRVRGLSQKRMPSADTLHYLNRLSSVLFALARFAAWKVGKKEEKPHY
ncbi:MAG: cob(I)yrinic acid a,c-diamide adenosyltransferase [Parcubacteria group bacterium]|nr:cob(I)yrinic acid a,c-diamide adenosyltransferase [Parcubacteria group bacterium]MBI2048917.1 cob(I)yrinic acid a,c-diamide adenosyltransferase [Parcubacteria group bacterium]